MKRRIKEIVVLCFVCSVIFYNVKMVSANISQSISIKKSFRDCYYSVIKFDKNKDGFLDQTEIMKIKALKINKDITYGAIDLKGISKLKYIQSLEIRGKNIKNLNEIRKLVNLKDIKINLNNKKSIVIDLRLNKKLKRVEIRTHKNKLKLYKNNKIKVLRLDMDKGISYMRRCPKAEEIEILGDKTTKKLVLKRNPRIKKVTFKEGKLSKIEVSNCTKLIELKILGNQKTANLKKIFIKNNFHIKKISIQNCRQLIELNLKNLTNLRKLDGKNIKKIEVLSLKDVPQIQELSWKNGNLSRLEITEKNELGKINFDNNKFTQFNYPQLKKLYNLSINDNKLTGTMNMNLYPQLSVLRCRNNEIEEIYGVSHKGEIYTLDCYNNRLKLIDLRDTEDLFYLDCEKNPNVTVYACLNDYKCDPTAVLYDQVLFDALKN